jgi:asparagine synthase (glutamine-hydrolysing)
VCGIVGRASKSRLLINDSWVRFGSDMIKHRGPDGSGFWSSDDAKVEFSHRRLAIVDTTELGAQPMLDNDLTISLIFNGEIYNFRELREQLSCIGYSFRSDCDTEVILASYQEWGRECVNKFNGMFVLALYDSNSGDVFIARDRAGEKPLYYFLDDDGISFASELKALVENNMIVREIDRSSLDCYLSFGFIPGARCIYSDVRKLEAGSWIVFNTSSGECLYHKYWALPESNCQIGMSSSEKNQRLEQFGSIFEDSISKQLEADVPVGILLSGGLDSSLVTAVATKFSDKLKTFNVRFPGFGKLDETEHARKVAKYFGTEHIELDANDADPELLINLAKQFDEPVIDSSMIPTYLISQEVRKHCTVALGGDGADELFGGYSHYERLLRMQKATRWMPFTVQKHLAILLSSILPDDIRGKNWLQSLNYDYNSETPLVATYFDDKSRTKLFGYDYLEGRLSADDIYTVHCASGIDLLDRATRTDFLTYLAEDILVKVDRASMMNSLEIRAPFLDYRIIEFAFSKIPSDLKVRGSSKKVFLQNYAAKILPSNFTFGRKQGFSIPLNHWLQRGPFKDFFCDILLASDCTFDRKYVNKILKNNACGRENGEKIFGLVMFELWRKSYGAKF